MSTTNRDFRLKSLALFLITQSICIGSFGQFNNNRVILKHASAYIRDSVIEQKTIISFKKDSIVLREEINTCFFISNQCYFFDSDGAWVVDSTCLSAWRAEWEKTEIKPLNDSCSIDSLNLYFNRHPRVGPTSRTSRLGSLAMLTYQINGKAQLLWVSHRKMWLPGKENTFIAKLGKIVKEQYK